MGNFSLEFSDTNHLCHDEHGKGGEKHKMMHLEVSKFNSCNAQIHHISQKTTCSSDCDKPLEKLPPKPPSTKKAVLGNKYNKRGNLSEEPRNSNKTVKDKSLGLSFFRRNRSNSMDVSQGNDNTSTAYKHDTTEFGTKQNDGSEVNKIPPSTPNLRRSFMNGLISPRFTRHLTFSSKRTGDKHDRDRKSFRSSSMVYEPPNSKLPTHRENSTISTSTRISGDATYHLRNTSFGHSCSSMQSLSSVDSQPNEFYDRISYLHPRFPMNYRESIRFDQKDKNRISLRRDPTVFGPRRTSNGGFDGEHFNSNLFLNINQGKLNDHYIFHTSLTNTIIKRLLGLNKTRFQGLH